MYVIGFVSFSLFKVQMLSSECNKIPLWYGVPECTVVTGEWCVNPLSSSSRVEM